MRWVNGLLICLCLGAPSFLEAGDACSELADFAWGQREKPEGLKTDALLILKNNEVVLEKYFQGYSSTSPHCLWSASKSISAALVGAAVESGYLNLNDSVQSIVGKWGVKIDSRILVRHLLSMSSAIQWNEPYEIQDPRDSTAIQMLYGIGRKNMTVFALSQPLMKTSPGSIWRYSSGDYQILMGLLKIQSQEREDTRSYEGLPWNILFNRIGASRVSMEMDSAGVYVGASYVHMTARDAAKVANLYLTGGRSEIGEQILPSNWPEMTAQLSEGYAAPATKIKNTKIEGVYGAAGWWINRPAKGFAKPYEKSPETMLLAEGHFGQVIAILPEQQMVLVRFGNDAEYDSKVDRLVSLAVECYK